MCGKHSAISRFLQKTRSNCERQLELFSHEADKFTDWCRAWQQSSPSDNPVTPSDNPVTPSDNPVSPSNNPVTRMTELEILPLPKAISYTLCTFLHDQMMSRGPNVVKVTMLGSGRTTRAEDSRLIRFERRKSLVGRNSFCVRTARIWNCLPKEIRTIDSKSLFCRRLKKLLLESTKTRLDYF